MEENLHCTFTVHEIGELQVRALSRESILPKMYRIRSGVDGYLLYTPYDCTVPPGYKINISTDLAVSIMETFYHHF